jgi:LytS/YehU family sensor histidine kinase
VLLSVLVLFLAVTLMEYLFPPKFIRKFPLTQMRKTRYGPPGSLPFFNPRNLFVLVSYTAAIMASTVFESVQLHRRQERIAGTIKRKKLEAEMKFLKSQINPHFLFNALNNVYTLSLIKSDHTPEVVMKLSEMLRYMLHESNQERVSLGQEIQYIENFISIQQLKDDAPLAVELNISVDEPATPVAPMILLPFIENAFKHSKVEDTKRGWIRIELLESHQHLQFRVVNSRFMISYTQDPTGGIGLQNVKRRLELEYPGRYELDIREEEEQFAVALSISLS